MDNNHLRDIFCGYLRDLSDLNWQQRYEDHLGLNSPVLTVDETNSGDQNFSISPINVREENYYSEYSNYEFENYFSKNEHHGPIQFANLGNQNFTYKLGFSQLML